MSKIKFLALFLFTVAITAVLAIGCSEDTTTNNQGGNPPNINMQAGAIDTFSVDSIQTNGNVVGTRFKTIHRYLNPITFQGKSNVFPVRAVTQDSLTSIPLVIDTFYVCYEAGKFYQWGIIQLLDPNVTPTWDLIADYTVAFGTQWTIAAGVVTQFGTVNIKSKVAVDTTFKTNGWGERDVNAYRSEITADIANIPFVYVDYFIGDADPSTNPSGLVRLRLRPFLTFAGVDQKVQRWFIP